MKVVLMSSKRDGVVYQDFIAANGILPQVMKQDKITD